MKCPYAVNRKTVSQTTFEYDENGVQLDTEDLTTKAAWTDYTSQNIDVKTVSNRLGHSQASTTIDIYTHALKQLDKKAAETLHNLLVKA